MFEGVVASDSDAAVSAVLLFLALAVLFVLLPLLPLSCGMGSVLGGCGV